MVQGVGLQPDVVLVMVLVVDPDPALQAEVTDVPGARVPGRSWIFNEPELSRNAPRGKTIEQVPIPVDSL